MQPSYSLLPIALVTDRNSLRKLFDYVSGHPGEHWRIEAELVEGTLFLTRWEANSVRIITGSLNSGYGHEFEKAFLKFEEDLRDSSTHHRIIEYEIAGMKWVVRYEADGYSNDKQENEGSMAVGVSETYPEVTAAVERLSLEFQPQPMMLEGVTVIQRGHLVSPESVIEVKCTTRKGSQIRSKTPQCWFSQTRHLFVGRHQDGQVNRVTKTEMSHVFDNWEKAHQDELRKLTALVNEIKVIAGQVSGRKCSIICNPREEPKALRVSRSNDNRLTISPEVREKYWPSSVKNYRINKPKRALREHWLLCY